MGLGFWCTGPVLRHILDGIEEHTGIYKENYRDIQGVRLPKMKGGPLCWTNGAEYMRTEISKAYN